TGGGAVRGAPDDVGEMHGREAVRRYLQDWVDMFEGLTVVAEELLEVEDQRVVAVIRVSGRAKLSGIETELRLAVVNSVRDGKIVRGREYIDREEALEAVGWRDWAREARRCASCAPRLWPPDPSCLYG